LSLLSTGVHCSYIMIYRFLIVDFLGGMSTARLWIYKTIWSITFSGIATNHCNLKIFLLTLRVYLNNLEVYVMLSKVLTLNK